MCLKVLPSYITPMSLARTTWPLGGTQPTLATQPMPRSNSQHTATQTGASTDTGIRFPRIGILNDYVRIPFANGSSFASQFLYREFSRLGSEVTVIGPSDPAGTLEDLPPKHVLMPSLPLRNTPGVRIPMPAPTGLKDLASRDLSVTVAQSCTGLISTGTWLRQAHGVPMVCVNTVHMPSVYDVLLPDSWHGNRLVDYVFQKKLVPLVESSTVKMYNGGDGLVVLSRGLKDYWLKRGVKVPIHVIRRSVDPEVFDQPAGVDPYPKWTTKGERLLVVCRHTKEKNVIRLLDIFAEHIAAKRPGVSLTLIGDGPDHELFKAHAKKLGVSERCLWLGEVGLTDMPRWYRHADVFVYTSLSETYGQVVSEALWCGLPVVAFDDDKGVADQVTHGVDGFLLRPESSDANADFATRTLRLLDDAALRLDFSAHAQANTRDRSDPARCVAAYERVLASARDHRDATWHGRAAFWTRVSPLLTVAVLHLLLALFGLLRRPAEVNRNGQKQPNWRVEPAGAARRVPPVSGFAGESIASQGSRVAAA